MKIMFLDGFDNPISKSIYNYLSNSNQIDTVNGNKSDYDLILMFGEVDANQTNTDIIDHNQNSKLILVTNDHKIITNDLIEYAKKYGMRYSIITESNFEMTKDMVSVSQVDLNSLYYSSNVDNSLFQELDPKGTCYLELQTSERLPIVKPFRCKELTFIGHKRNKVHLSNFESILIADEIHSNYMPMSFYEALTNRLCPLFDSSYSRVIMGCPYVVPSWCIISNKDSLGRVIPSYIESDLVQCRLLANRTKNLTITQINSIITATVETLSVRGLPSVFKKENKLELI
jgi:hypothetical protein